MEANKKQNWLEREMKKVVLFHILMDVVTGKTRLLSTELYMCQKVFLLPRLKCLWNPSLVSGILDSGGPRMFEGQGKKKI